MATLTRFKKNDAITAAAINANFTALNASEITDGSFSPKAALPNDFIESGGIHSIILHGEQTATSFDAVDDEIMLGTICGDLNRDVIYTLSAIELIGNSNIAGGSTDGVISVEYLVPNTGGPASGTWTAITTLASFNATSTASTVKELTSSNTLTVPKQESRMFRLRVSSAPSTPFSAGTVLGGVRFTRGNLR